MKRNFSLLWGAGLLCMGMATQAAQVCDIDGQSVNPSNGHTTAGKTGIMRCRDGEGGPLLREEEFQNGKSMGLVRRYKNGVLASEHRVNERGNRDGLAREFAAKPGATNPLLREETFRDSRSVGIARTWHESGQLKRVSFHTDEGREQAVAEFTADGKLTELRCAGRAQLVPHADDAQWCGHSGASPAVVTLYDGKGQIRGKLTHERGERRGTELYWSNGKPRQQIEATAQGSVEREFSQEGVKRRETHWVADGKQARRYSTLDREYHENGTLVRERRWTPTDGNEALQLEQQWYLNGQPREKREPVKVDGRTGWREMLYHDNGQLAFDGVYLASDRYGHQAVGTHKSFDTSGRLRRERQYDARGRVNRERELDESGKVVRDDELFEDGSRKAYAR